jgi:uncharacterized protein (DUF2235 family)
MPKNIVFCADGTWNGPGQADSDDPNSPASNVFKLFLTLAGVDAPGTAQLAKEQERTLTVEGEIQQVAKYLHGVGDSSNLLDRLIGGEVGVGLITRVVRGYTFVSRNYAAGDKIHLVGFSRGAYTARALAGLISAMGLLSPAVADPDNKGAAYRAGAAIWYQWRRDVLSAMGHRLDHFAEIMVDLPHFFHQPPDLTDMLQAPIEAVAVWDTVGALGIPIFSGQHAAVDVFQFADTTLNGNVRNGRHAISIDEEREDFTPTLWASDPGRIVQVLFPGAHADVGGGYPTSNNESGLSDIALRWIGRELRELGMIFAPEPVIAFHPDPAGTAHRPWEEPLWLALPRAARQLPPGLGLSQSVIDRINAGPVLPDPRAPAARYLPTNIDSYLSGNAAASGVTVMNGSHDWP